MSTRSSPVGDDAGVDSGRLSLVNRRVVLSVADGCQLQVFHEWQY